MYVHYVSDIVYIPYISDHIISLWEDIRAQDDMGPLYGSDIRYIICSLYIVYRGGLDILCMYIMYHI